MTKLQVISGDGVRGNGHGSHGILRDRDHGNGHGSHGTRDDGGRRTHRDDSGRRSLRDDGGVRRILRGRIHRVHLRARGRVLLRFRRIGAQLFWQFSPL